MVTLQAVADAAGVSTTTVSRVVNEMPRVSPYTRQKVLQLIHEMGYRPDPAARALAARRLRGSD
ncbi:LacI family DNA-binding transcriptional regulator [Allorhizocola rhizosphaerae]|uniref:LacI family DNA-binding transcriptional regulator n=1 Tax=Allorhizocola rhizosphaerae TaxID=1872709 RepID=UPI000E3E1912|nr:LacI family DNA-binding transcriptional regulator [Allorhizocola rhizosphaerae]